jgi:peptide/nickel transport system permease protein
MSRYLVARIVAIFPVLFVISLLAFGLEAITPGDPAILLLQAAGVETITPETIALKHAELHLDDPLPVRYASWLVHALHGDFGRSFRSYTPVTQLYAERIGATMLLAICATVAGALIAVPLGTIAAYRQGGPLDGVAQVVAVLGSAVPGFWIALMAIYVFSVQLHWLPVFGTPTPRGILMPASVLALAHTATVTRLTRAAVLDTLGQDYVRVARAKGLTTLAVARRHVLPNTLVPVLTVLGLETAHLMTGAAVVEYVFAWPGIGKLAVDAALLHDTPVIVGFAVAAGLIFVTLNLAVDLGVATVDPRVRSV